MKIIFQPGDYIRLQDDISLSSYPCYVVKLIKKLNNHNWEAQLKQSMWNDDLEKEDQEIVSVSEEAFEIPLFY
jgi:hypothetical protein